MYENSKIVCDLRPDYNRMKFTILDFLNFPKFNELSKEQKIYKSICFLTKNNELFIFHNYSICKDDYLLEKTYKIKDEISYPEMKHIIECINECKSFFKNV